MVLTRQDIYKFLEWHNLAVLATVTPECTPEAALVEFAVTPELEIIFDTLGNTRKCENLRHTMRIALVVGWDSAETLQVEGLVDEPSGDELERVQNAYFAGCPQGLRRQGWPGLTYFRVRPQWVRLSNYNRPRHIEEINLN